ncbi:MAG: hypothetical protein WAR78_09815 [Ferruginibacter sp.]
MQLPVYKYKTNASFLDYEFISEGSKGNIKKVIRFTQIEHNTFNLAFGDLNEVTGEISDISVTNNDDSRKVLATVAATVYDFTDQYPGSLVVAKGSTISRTRLYRMGITNYLKQISVDFEVYGLKDGNWETFTERRDYEAFLIRRK